MPFHHVLLALKSDPAKLRCVLTDLSAEELTEQFLKPYRRGQDITCGNGIVIPVSQIRKLHIVRTERTNADERSEMRQRITFDIENFNKQSDTVLLFNVSKGNAPEDIIKVGKDITAVTISGPLGRE